MDSDLLADVREAQREAELRQDLETRQILNDFREVFGTPAGRRVFMHILRQCYFFASTFTGNSRGFFLEGRRAVGLELTALMGRAEPTVVAEIIIKGFKEVEDGTKSNSAGRSE